MDFLATEPESGPPIGLKIELTSYDTQGVYRDLIQELTRQLMGRFGDFELTKQVTAAVQAQVDAKLDAAITSAVAGLLTKPIQRHDTFGDKIGEPLSVADIIRDGAGTYLMEQVGSDGKPSRNTYSTRMARVDFIVQDVVLRGLDADLREHAKEARAAISAKAAEAVAEVLTRVK